MESTPAGSRNFFEEMFELNHPCPDSLLFCKSIFYRPIVIMGNIKKFLQSGGCGEFANFTGENVSDPSV